ncbi:hypothetical protein FF125_19025 [Aureibaculum algae]|uniref:Uncharacterized protein n=1 Tax=Aureibaculum algae TaxID=2584122 RepID=A0A5B7TUC0_9FLAO|nr:hypothetical protein [Aureibaculum algae]QCX40435.1 hypothetical protein FF125_19025 [Aureibaculum algae]
MGNRAYLSIQTEKDSNELLFEANNSLPFFWIGLLDDEILDNVKPVWLEIEELLNSEDDDKIEDYFRNNPNTGSFRVEKKSFLQNIHKTQLFLESYAPESIPIFNDFRSFIHSKFTKPNQYLLLDILEIAGFTSISELISNLYDEIKIIKTQNLQGITHLVRHDLIAGGTGFSTEFEELSSFYAKEMKDRMKNTPNYPNVKIITKKSLTPHIAVLILAPLFTYITYRGYIKEGFSSTVIILGLSNIMFYSYSIFRLIQISTVIQSKKS